MKRLVNCLEMKQIDSATIEEKGIPSCVLMERAALKTAEEIEKRFKKDDAKILCVCGGGNNGGDGAAIARILFLHGYNAEILMVGDPDHRTAETMQQLAIARAYHVPMKEKADFSDYTVIVDALFGVGLTRDITGSYADVIENINNSDAFKAAVDLPSGINGDTGTVMGCAVRADLTVTFAFLKTGLSLYPGREYAGETIVSDVGIYDEEKKGSIFALETSDLKMLPERAPSGNKGTFGKVLAVAGCEDICGAAYLCSAAAFASGAGMVRILTAKENRTALQKLLPEAMISCEPDENSYEALYQWADVLICGPGIGMKNQAEQKLLWFLKRNAIDKKPMILDADGLNILALHPGWKQFLHGNVILTPHMGEMSRLTGCPAAELAADRIASARKFTEDSRGVLVLKDACTVISGSQEMLYVNLSGNAGMATAGSGDVLSGILAGTVCRFLPSQNSVSMTKKAALGTYLHGLAGDLAADTYGVPGMKAGDMIICLPKVFI